MSYLLGYTEADANPDIGDSSITETIGIGGFAMACAPAIVKFVGGNAQDAIANTREMYRITQTKNAMNTIPILDFEGTPLGIDARKVADSLIQPVINTGMFLLFSSATFTFSYSYARYCPQGRWSWSSWSRYCFSSIRAFH